MSESGQKNCFYFTEIRVSSQTIEGLRAFSFLRDTESFPVREISHSLKIPYPSL